MSPQQAGKHPKQIQAAFAGKKSSTRKRYLPQCGFVKPKADSP
jgi:hypothetical protein